LKTQVLSVALNCTAYYPLLDNLITPLLWFKKLQSLQIMLQKGQLYRVQDNFMLDSYLLYKGTITLRSNNKLIYIFEEYEDDLQDWGAAEIDFDEDRMKQLTITPY
jgi:hypothetical protein